MGDFFFLSEIRNFKDGCFCLCQDLIITSAHAVVIYRGNWEHFHNNACLYELLGVYVILYFHKEMHGAILKGILKNLKSHFKITALKPK